jgi:hypothetical protein
MMTVTFVGGSTLTGSSESGAASKNLKRRRKISTGSTAKAIKGNTLTQELKNH